MEDYFDVFCNGDLGNLLYIYALLYTNDILNGCICIKRLTKTTTVVAWLHETNHVLWSIIYFKIQNMFIGVPSYMYYLDNQSSGI